MADTGRSELIRLSGPSGIGKTALAESLALAGRPVVGRTLRCKFDATRRHSPFACLAESLQTLLVRLDADDAGSVPRWRERFSATLEGKLPQVCDLLPAMASFVGPQPDAAECGSLRVLRRIG